MIINNRLHYATCLRERGVKKPILLYQHNVLSPGYLQKHYRSVTAIIAVSKHVLLAARSSLFGQDLQGGFVHNGVDPAFWSPADPTTLSAGAPRVLFVGRLAANKGAHIVVQAMPGVLRRHSGAQLVVIGASRHDLPEGNIGDSAYEKQLTRLAKQLAPNNITFLGNLPPDSVVKEYRRTTIGLMPSLGFAVEGHPMTVLEGMACGLAMICNRVPGVPETITHQKDGILIDNYLDPDEWARQIVRLLDDEELRARLGRNARQTVLERFTIDRMVKDFRAYIESFL